jgi:hypothetical protein
LDKGEELLGNFEVFCPGKSIDKAKIRKLKAGPIGKK